MGVVALVGGLVFWLTTRSATDTAEPPAPATSPAPTADPADLTRLERHVPRGYPAGACSPGDLSEGVVAELNCGRNTDVGGPLSATYTLAQNEATLDAVFDAEVADSSRVNCPGNIQSPGPWRRNATPDRISGQLFCGLRDGQPTVVWTDVDRMTISAVRAGPQGPTFPQLYSWWSSHS